MRVYTYIYNNIYNNIYIHIKTKNIYQNTSKMHITMERELSL